MCAVTYAAETWLDLTRPFSGALIERFESFGTESWTWRPKLLRYMATSDLTPEFGGNKDCKPCRDLTVAKQRRRPLVYLCLNFKM